MSVSQDLNNGGFSAVTLQDYHASDGDGVLDERRFAPLPRAGITNLGNTCFLSSSVQLLARALIAARSATAAGTLAARAADVALHAVLGVHCSTAALQDLLTTLPCGSEWRVQLLCQTEAVPQRFSQKRQRRVTCGHAVPVVNSMSKYRRQRRPSHNSS